MLWLIPIAAILLFVFAGGAVGLLIVANQYSLFDSSNTNAESTTKPTPEESPDLEDPSPEASTTPFANVTPDDTPESTSTVKPDTTGQTTPRPVIKSTPRPVKTIAPRTPAQTPRRTPRPTPKRTPKKNMDCIFTDSCK
jgi:hypothetical protein